MFPSGRPYGEHLWACRRSALRSVRAEVSGKQDTFPCLRRKREIVRVLWSAPLVLCWNDMPQRYLKRKADGLFSSSERTARFFCLPERGMPP